MHLTASHKDFLATFGRTILVLFTIISCSALFFSNAIIFWTGMKLLSVFILAVVVFVGCVLFTTKMGWTQ